MWKPGNPVLEFNSPWSPLGKLKLGQLSTKDKVKQILNDMSLNDMTDVYLWVNCCIKHTETYTTDIQLFHSARFHLLGQIKQASTMSRTVVLPLTRIAFVLHTIDAPSLSCSGEKIWEDFFKGVLRLLVHDRLHMLLPANWCKDVSGHAETYIHPSKVSKRHWDFVIHDFSD